MNNLDQIFRLIDAGYTKEEINELFNPVVDAEASKNENPEEPKNENPDNASNPALDIEALSNAINGLNEKIKELDTSIKKGNILNSSLNLPKEQTAEDVLASILTPEPKKK